MPLSTFAYEVRDSSGNALTGQVQGETPQVVAQRLRDQGYTVVRISEQQAPRVREPGRQRVSGRVSHEAYAQFYRELATCIGAGMTVVQSLHTLESATSSYPLRVALRGVLPGVERGQRLSENMRRFPDVFSALAVAVVTAGEEAGKLEEMLQVLAAYAEHDLELHRMLRRETFYPKILLLAIFTIVPVGLLIANAISGGFWGFWALLPIAALLGLGGLVGLGVLLLRAYQGSRQGRLVIDRIKLSLPLFGGLTRRIAMSRFCRALASLYSAGVGMPKAVDHAAEASANLALEKAIRDVIPHVQAGGQLSHALAGQRLVPDLVVSMLRTGEQTGNIDHVLNKVADYYDDETRTKVHQLGQAIVPICVVVAGFVVLAIVFLFFTRMYLPVISDAVGG